MPQTATKAYKGLSMEGFIARWYERTSRKDLEEYRALAQRLISIPPENGSVLEVAPGPGFLAIELARTGRLRVTGLDISKTFIDLAAANAAQAGVQVDFRQGNAAEMPFPTDSFDLLVCRAAFKNFAEPDKALREMRRVLRPGATGVIIDLHRDVAMPDIKRYVDGLHLRAPSRAFTLFTFRFMLLKRAYTRQQFEALLAPIGFSKTEIRTNAIGLEAWLVK
jgi:ubiquinone/menaquinone biosynthesis C-methylase UbiE